MPAGLKLQRTTVAGRLGVCLVLLVGCQKVADGPAAPSSDLATVGPPAPTGASDAAVGGSLHPVAINRPAGPPRIRLAGVDPAGQSASVACSTCHSIREARLTTKTTEAFKEFHVGLTVRHGGLACYACHNPGDADTLRLADGAAVDYRDVMQLCAQCHGPQATAYEHGAHGGMNGFWDRRRGPQTKNNCIDCHPPHAPAFPRMVVTFKPRDRFQEVPGHLPSEDAHAHGSGHDE